MTEIKADGEGLFFPSVSLDNILLSLTETVYASLLLFKAINEELDLYFDF